MHSFSASSFFSDLLVVYGAPTWRVLAQMRLMHPLSFFTQSITISVVFRSSQPPQLRYGVQSLKEPQRSGMIFCVLMRSEVKSAVSVYRVWATTWANPRYVPLSWARMTKSGMVRPVHSFRSSSHCLFCPSCRLFPDIGPSTLVSNSSNPYVRAKSVGRKKKSYSGRPQAPPLAAEPNYFYPSRKAAVFFSA